MIHVAFCDLKLASFYKNNCLTQMVFYMNFCFYFLKLFGFEVINKFIEVFIDPIANEANLSKKFRLLLHHFKVISFNSFYIKIFVNSDTECITVWNTGPCSWLKLKKGLFTETITFFKRHVFNLGWRVTKQSL
jgi:hypothetical protein